MPAIPDKLPTWVRNSDYVILRFVALACLARMFGGF